MNERNLSRKLSGSVVDALKAHGHILVVKGGGTALARELDDLMAPEIATIEPRLKPLSVLVGEPTSTFGDENVDQAVEDMVLKLTHALMNSDHVEDVFAEDAVIRRDIFRAVRDGLREPGEGGGEAGGEGDQATVTVKLDALGYVAATAGRRAEPSTLRQALDRAASVAGARFSGFSPELREATFRLEGGGDDERLELEEAVADELTDLVEQGVIELPTIERRIDLGRALPASEQRALRGRIAAAAEATLLRSGCAAEWELADPRTLRVLFTPLSEQDARGVDAPTSAFAREIAALLASRGESKAPAARNGEHVAREAPPSAPTKAAARPEPEPSAPIKAEAGKPARAAPAEEPSAPARRKAKSAAEAPKSPAPAATEPAPKRAARKSSTKEPASSRKGTAKEPASSRKGTAKEPASSRKGTAKEPASARKSTAAEARASAPKPTGKRASSAKTTKAPTKKR